MANWFEKILPSFIRKETTKKSTIPEGLWQSCNSCGNILYVPELESNLSTTQSPSQTKSLRSALAGVTAELSVIQKILVGMVGVAAASALTDDPYDDNVSYNYTW